VPLPLVGAALVRSAEARRLATAIASLQEIRKALEHELRGAVATTMTPLLSRTDAYLQIERFGATRGVLSLRLSLHQAIRDHHGPNRQSTQASKTATPGSIPGSPALLAARGTAVILLV